MTRPKTSRPRTTNPADVDATTDPAIEEPAEIRFPIDGHTAGEHAYIAIRRKGEQWAVIDNRGGQLGPDFYDGRLWAPLTEKYQHLAYRWTKAEAEALAKNYAAVASEVHQRYASMVRPEFADWLAGKTETLVATVRRAVSA